MDDWENEFSDVIDAKRSLEEAVEASLFYLLLSRAVNIPRDSYKDRDVVRHHASYAVGGSCSLFGNDLVLEVVQDAHAGIKAVADWHIKVENNQVIHGVKLLTLGNYLFKDNLAVLSSGHHELTLFENDLEYGELDWVIVGDKYPERLFDLLFLFLNDLLFFLVFILLVVSWYIDDFTVAAFALMKRVIYTAEV